MKCKINRAASNALQYEEHERMGIKCRPDSEKQPHWQADIGYYTDEELAAIELKNEVMNDIEREVLLDLQAVL